MIDKLECFGLGVVLGVFLLFWSNPACAGPLLVENDNGGDPMPYIIRNKQKVPMEIRGDCWSSCTIYLGNPRACFHRDAVLYFHMGSFDYLRPDKWNLKTRKPNAGELRSYKHWVEPQYSKKVRAWIKKQGGLLVTFDRYLILKGKELHRLARICPSSETDNRLAWDIDLGFGPVVHQPPPTDPPKIADILATAH